MRLEVTESQRIELEAAAAAERGGRRWRRYRAVLLLAEAHAPVAVAHALRCSRASVYAWAAGWRAAGRWGSPTRRRCASSRRCAPGGASAGSRRQC